MVSTASTVSCGMFGMISLSAFTVIGGRLLVNVSFLSNTEIIRQFFRKYSPKLVSSGTMVQIVIGQIESKLAEVNDTHVLYVNNGPTARAWVYSL